MKIFKVSVSYDEGNWNIYVISSSFKEAYDSLEEFDRINAEFISCEDEIYSIDRSSDELFKLLEPVELPF
jgi:hypothetical protein